LEKIKKLFFAIFLVFFIIGVGIAGYMLIEDYPFLEALWLTVITVTTVGYGIPLPLSVYGHIFTVFLIIVGVGLMAYAFGTIVGVVMEGHLKNVVGRRAMEKRIVLLRDHIIVCGAGRVGHQVIQRLEKEKVPFIVLDNNQELINELLARGILALHGDATEDELLIRAGIHRAKGLVSALSGDANNVFVTLTSKGLNPTITVVARAERLESEEKLQRAGADKVIAPSVIGGRRMAISILKPVSVDFVETVIYNKGMEIEIEEVPVLPNCPLTNTCLRDSNIKQSTGAMVVAIQRGEKFVSNPDAGEMILANDMLIVLGTREQLAALEKLASCKE
jgi:voltage-gated potassium channel